MKKQTKVRLCLALLALVSVLGLELTGSNAIAAPCCTECEEIFNSCLEEGWHYSQCNGGDPACCEQVVRGCRAWCNFDC